MARCVGDAVVSAAAWPVVLLVLAAAAVIGWPTGGARSRYRALFRSGRQVSPPVDGDVRAYLRHVVHLPGFRRSGPGRASGGRAAAGPPNRRDPSRPVGEGGPGTTGGHAGIGPTMPATATDAARRLVDAGGGVTSRWAASPRRNMVLTAGVGAVGGGLLAGPVAALVAAAYSALGMRALLRRRLTRSAERLRRHRLDQLGALAADLRAGLPVPTTLTDESALSGAGRSVPARVGDGPAAPDGVDPADRPERSVDDAAGPAPLDRIDRLTRAAIRLADRTGAPLAELVERIEADMRAMDRGLAAAAAQAAGARATAWLLAALPLGGIALGYGIGVDPVRVLLHTPVGAGCAVVATLLQVVGLLWAERLGATPGGAT
ncbi:tight adherence protein B [Micromonospora inyonensis]|uniref:Tight adherence protein B n=1 Tax=Micromonospora inyonensis TaxID=47866 RepID=A0A1C6RIC0_9ACTN|nr:tight adherence protein B [Micromonospora inyonensis]